MICSCSVAKSYPVFRNLVDCSPPASSDHGISQGRILEWVVIFFSRGSSQPRDWTQASCIGKWVLYHWATRETLYSMVWCFKLCISDCFKSSSTTVIILTIYLAPAVSLCWSNPWQACMALAFLAYILQGVKESKRSKRQAFKKISRCFQIIEIKWRDMILIETWMGIIVLILRVQSRWLWKQNTELKLINLVYLWARQSKHRLNRRNSLKTSI